MVPPLLATFPAPNALLESASRTPWVRTVPPVYELFPDKIKVPVPCFVSVPLPEISFLQLSEALYPPFEASIVTVTSLFNAP